MTPTEAKRLLDSLATFGMRFGLDRMERALDALGRPDRAFRVLHVAGTNGKGSTCAFAASILRAAGLRVGLYTSPHLVEFNERIQVGGRDIPDAALAEGVETIVRAFPAALDRDDPMTFFEFGTLLALWHFARERVDVAVLEVGLGGRLDATNAVASEVAVVTRIGLDHTAILGKTLAAIAGEKAGIFKGGTRAVIHRQPVEAREVLVAAARRNGGEPLVADEDFALEGEGPYLFRDRRATIPGLTLSLLGAHQRENAEGAIAAARLLVPGLPDAAIREGLASAAWPGRLEIVGRTPLTVVDGAHNPDGAGVLAQAVRELWAGTPVHLVFGVLGDKDVEAIARTLVPLASRAYLAAPKNERALPLEALSRLVAKLSVPASTFPSIAEAIDAARRDALGSRGMVLVAGSLYVVGEAKRHLQAAGSTAFSP